MARLFLGGRGLGARLLWDLVGPDVEPLSPQNVLIFATGPLTASGAQTSNRFSVTTKSPLTGTILDANSCLVCVCGCPDKEEFDGFGGLACTKSYVR